MLHFADNIEYSADNYGADWADAFTLSDWHLRLSVEQAHQLHQELNTLLDRYRDLPEEPGAPRLVAQIQLFPMPDANPERDS
jgi:hypothetical protein